MTKGLKLGTNVFYMSIKCEVQVTWLSLGKLGRQETKLKMSWWDRETRPRQRRS